MYYYLSFQKTFILHSVTHSAAMGLISPREFIDLVRVERNYDGGKYFACGKTSHSIHPQFWPDVSNKYKYVYTVVANLLCYDYLTGC